MRQNLFVLKIIRFYNQLRARTLEHSELKVRKRSELGRHACSFVHPPEITQKKHASPSCHSKNQAKNINISLEVSSSLFVLQHLCTNIKISLPEITISRRRLNKSLKIAKPTIHETIKTAADQWTPTEKSCYSYSNASTIIVEKHWFWWYSLGFISKS